MVCINCCGTMNIIDAFNPTDEIKFYVFDIHRPLDIFNIHNEGGICVIDDGRIDDIPNPSLLMQNESQEEDGEEEEEEEENSEENSEENTEDGSIRESEYDSENITENNRKRKRKQNNNKLLKEEITKKIKLYYRGNYYGLPVSHIMYSLCKELCCDNNDNLWYCLIGITFHYLFNHINKMDYNNLIECYKSEVLDKNGYESDNSIGLSPTSVITKKIENGKIEYVDELNFGLYRYWNIYESMKYSEYISCKLGVNEKKVEDNLKEFLAKSGLSLKECTEEYSFMSLSTKKEMVNKMNNYIGEFGLDDFNYSSFTRISNYNEEYGVSDMVYGINGILENYKILNDDNNMILISEEGEGDKEEKVENIINEMWKEKFYEGYNLLSINENKKLLETFKKGIEIRKRLERTIVKVNTAIFDQQLLKNSGKFRYIILNQINNTDLNNLMNPYSLNELSSYITYANHCFKRWLNKNQKPLVICCPLNCSNKYLICTSMCSEKGQMERNSMNQILDGIIITNKPIALYKLKENVYLLDISDIELFIECLHTMSNESDNLENI